MRLVTSKNADPPESTSQRASTPAPREYPRRLRRSSATPPPLAVELTFQITRPRSAPRPGR